MIIQFQIKSFSNGLVNEVHTKVCTITLLIQNVARFFYKTHFFGAVFTVQKKVRIPTQFLHDQIITSRKKLSSQGLKFLVFNE